MLEIKRQMKSRGAEGMKRLLGPLLISQASALLGVSFAQWVDYHREERVAQIREEAPALRSRRQESS